MELVDNAVIVAVPGAMDAGLASLLFWGSLTASLAVAFVVTVPVNRFMIGRGKGHAVVHADARPRARPRRTARASALVMCVTVPHAANTTTTVRRSLSVVTDPAPQKPARDSSRPPDPPMVPFAPGGMAIWLVLGLIFLSIRRRWPSTATSAGSRSVSPESWWRCLAWP